MRVLGYARVSSVGQADGTSLRDQQDAIRAYSKTRSLEVAKFYVEAESAVYERIEHREQMRNLLADVRRGDLVLCDKLDRWSRDPEFTYRSIREILAKGAHFYAVGDRCDPSTPDGDTMLGFRVLFAREEHKRIKQRLVGTRKILRDQGYYVEGLPPIGYLRPKTSNRLEHNVLVIDPERAPLVKQIFAWCIGGESVRTIQAKLPRYDFKRIGHVLRSRVYLGEIQDSRGLWIKARHPALIDARTFSRAQTALDGRRLGGARASAVSHTKSWLLREVGVCGKCGAKISAAYGGGRPYKYYYRCPKNCPGYASVPTNDAAVADAVFGRLVELRAALARPAKETPAKDSAPRLAALQRKRERYLEAFADGNATGAELKLALAKIDAERTRLESVTPPKRDRREVLGQVKELAKAWGTVKVEGKRRILRRLVRSVAIAKDSPPRIAWIPSEELE